MADIKSKVYNALSDIMFETNASKQDMDMALDWFESHFWEESEDINIDDFFEEESKEQMTIFDLMENLE